MKIRIEQLAYQYPSGVQALRGISLLVESGEALALVGENGAGKSTLAKHLNGLLKPDSGRVLIGDWDTRQHSVARMAQHVGFAFQNPDEQLFERSLRAEVAFGPRNLGRSERQVQAAVEESLLLVGLEDQSETHPYDLNPSQRKLVSLASVLAMDTPVVVLDEPTSGQDAGSIRRIAEIIKQLQEAGRTIIVISHDLDFVLENIARVAIMAGGEVLSVGPAASILSQESHLRRAALEAPQLIRLAQSLGMQTMPDTNAAFLEAFRAWQSDRRYPQA